MQQQYHLHQSWLWLILLPLLGLASCSGVDTDDAGNLPAASTMPISFTALSKWDEAQAKSSSAPHTRLSENSDTKTLSFDKNDAIGVFAYLNDSDTPNFMNNQKVTYDGTNWNYSPVKYWPNNEEDKLSFYAYYPSSAENSQIKVSSSDDASPSVTYDNMKGDVDLMVAEAFDQKYSTCKDGVKFNFKHLLARVKFRFTVKSENGADYRPVIHVLKYKIPHYKGIFSLEHNSDGSISPKLTKEEKEGDVEIVRYVDKDEGETITEEGIDIPEFTAYLFPCKFPCDNAQTEIGSFTISLNNVEHTFKPSSLIPVEQGNSYILSINIESKTNTTNFFITSYSMWEEGTDFNGELK